MQKLVATLYDIIAIVNSAPDTTTNQFKYQTHRTGKNTDQDRKCRRISNPNESRFGAIRDQPMEGRNRQTLTEHRYGLHLTMN
ncbi:hypothetical protein BDR03DRAFT_452147 [Suillus americanus]|nr:hypothetical protein BDR03DRAFT_452147 [Suillus americanus]